MTPSSSSPPPHKLRVLIVGAGIAGNGLAYWLAKHGHNVTVIERHPCLRTNGLQLDLRGHGIEVMKLMGLEQAVREKCVPEEGIALVDSSGKRKAFFAANKTGQGSQSVTSEFEIMRGHLCRLLCDAAEREGARVEFGVGVQGFEEREGGSVKVRLSDGTDVEVDLLVGCDGLGSKVRRLMEESGEDKALTNMPERIAYFTMAEPRKEGEQYVGTGCAFPGPNKRMMLIRRHCEERVQVYLMANEAPGSDSPLNTLKRGDAHAEKAVFADMFRGLGWRADDAVKALETGAEDFYCQHTGVVRRDSWSRGHVALVGDAGYGSPPDGFGTSMALVGAYILAGEIERAYGKGAAGEENGGETGNEDPLRKGLEEYENTFGPYMKKILSGYSAQPGWFDSIPWTPLTIGLFNNAIAAVTVLRLDQLAMKFMPTERSDWKLPAYSNGVKA